MQVIHQITKLTKNLTSAHDYDRFTSYIRNFHRIRIIGTTSTFLLGLLLLTTIVPLYNITGVEDTEAATGTAQNSTLTFTSTRLTASTDLNINNVNGTFSTSNSSNQASFNLKTNNYTGYTLTLAGSSSTTALKDNVSNNTLSSISSNTTYANFSANNTTGQSYNNKWGLLPSSYKTGGSVVSNTTTYLPSPSSINTITMDETSNANSTAKSYTIGLGVRANYDIMSGTYNNTNANNAITLAYVANPITYSITYDGGSGGTNISNLPTFTNNSHTQSGNVSTTSITLSDTIPARTGYDFKGWCMGTINTSSNNDTCTGTVYNANGANTVAARTFGIDKTTTNTTTLHAMWNIKTFTCNKRYRLQNDNGTWGDWQSDGSVTVNYNTTCSYSKSVTDYKNTANGTNNAQASTSIANVTADKTGDNSLSLSFYRNTYTLTASNGSNVSDTKFTTAAVHGTNYFRWGQEVALSTTKASNVTCTTYGTPSWTQSGTSGTFSSTSGATPTFTMGKGNVTVTAKSTATAIKQTVSFATSNASGITFNGTNYTNGQSVSIACGTYNISTNGFPTGYEFSSWSRANGVAVTDSTTASTKATITGTGTLTLNGKKKTFSLKVNFSGSGVSSVQVRTASGTGGTLKGTVSTSGGSVSGLEYNTAYYLYPTFSSGKEFSAWAKNSTAGTLSSTSASNPTFTMGNGAGEVTVTGKNKLYMQDITLANCPTANTIVYDKRDEKSYTIRKINNQCWMTQNLRFTGTSVPAATSNVTADAAMTYYSLDANDASYTDHCDSTNSYNYACIKDSGNATTGVWYNYYAASAGTVSTNSNSTDATEDICPKNWHLPTGPNTTADTDINKLVGNTTSGWQDPTSGFTAFGAVTGGGYDDGSRSSTELGLGSGFWWSATAVNATNRYSLRYNSSDGQFRGNGSNRRYYGFFVRCVHAS